jgi:hypothetical protein
VGHGFVTVDVVALHKSVVRVLSALGFADHS